MKQFLTASVAALALLLMTGMGVRADPTPSEVSWTYNFSPGAPAVYADGNPTAGVFFTNELTKSGGSSSNYAVTNLSTFSVASATSPDVLITNGAYSLSVNLASVDAAGVHSGSLTFTGKLTGSFSADNSNIDNVFGPNPTQTLELGSYSFTVSLTSYTPPGPPGSSLLGAIGAHIDVSNLSLPGVPEPGTMLLSGLGLSFLGGAAWRKRRQARVAVAS